MRRAISCAFVVVSSTLLTATTAAPLLDDAPQQQLRPSPKPHIVTIMLDDFGWGNWGIHAEQVDNAQLQREVQTPNMDALAREGIVLDRHYVHNVCGPTRTAFMSGRNTRHVLMRIAPPMSYDPDDPLLGIAGMPLNMTGIGGERLVSIRAVVHSFRPKSTTHRNLGVQPTNFNHKSRDNSKAIQSLGSRM